MILRRDASKYNGSGLLYNWSRRDDERHSVFFYDDNDRMHVLSEDVEWDGNGRDKDGKWGYGAAEGDQRRRWRAGWCAWVGCLQRVNLSWESRTQWNSVEPDGT